MLAVAQATVPPTPAWNPTVGIIMAIFNILGIVIAGTFVKNKGVGPSLPFPIPGFSRKNFSLAQFIAGLSFGHILATGVILGLTNRGIL